MLHTKLIIAFFLHALNSSTNLIPSKLCLLIINNKVSRQLWACIATHYRPSSTRPLLTFLSLKLIKLPQSDKATSPWRISKIPMLLYEDVLVSKLLNSSNEIISLLIYPCMENSSLHLSNIINIFANMQKKINKPSRSKIRKDADQSIKLRNKE